MMERGRGAASHLSTPTTSYRRLDTGASSSTPHKTQQGMGGGKAFLVTVGGTVKGQSDIEEGGISVYQRRGGAQHEAVTATGAPGSAGKGYEDFRDDASCFTSNAETYVTPWWHSLWVLMGEWGRHFRMCREMG